MPDVMDQVQEQIDEFQADALAEHKRRTAFIKASLETCCICGDEIPQARREAMPGCCKCITCQSEWESMHGRG